LLANILNNLRQTAQKQPLLDFDYSIIRSKRKTLCIQIRNARVRVLAPARLAQQDILDFLAHKQSWVNKQLIEQAKTLEQKQEIAQSNHVFINGQLKTLTILRGNYLVIDESELSWNITVPNRVCAENLAKYSKQQLLNWYKQQALVYLPKRLEQLSNTFALYPSNVQVKKYKARWGSCNSKGVINLNYLLMMTPPFVVDYVIIHELCHLKHLNHSAAFWQLVADCEPNYKTAQQWLKTNSVTLNTIHL
jgi:predicted metal-dependent hydrolase